MLLKCSVGLELSCTSAISAGMCSNCTFGWLKLGHLVLTAFRPTTSVHHQTGNSGNPSETMVGTISAQTNAGYRYVCQTNTSLLGKVGTLKLRLSRNRFFFYSRAVAVKVDFFLRTRFSLIFHTRGSLFASKMRKNENSKNFTIMSAKVPHGILNTYLRF